MLGEVKEVTRKDSKRFLMNSQLKEEGNMKEGLQRGIRTSRKHLNF